MDRDRDTRWRLYQKKANPPPVGVSSRCGLPAGAPSWGHLLHARTSTTNIPFALFARAEHPARFDPLQGDKALGRGRCGPRTADAPSLWLRRHEAGLLRRPRRVTARRGVPNGRTHLQGTAPILNAQDSDVARTPSGHTAWHDYAAH